MTKLRGTVFVRPNGTFTALTDPIWDSKEGRFRRPSLGTFSTELEAEQARLDFNSAIANGVFALPELEQRQARLDTYLAEWLGLLDREQEVGRIARATRRDYETIVRLHILPHLGTRRLGELSTSTLSRWLMDLKAAGVGDRTVQKAYRTLHRALADSELRENPARLPKRYRPKIRERRPVKFPTGEQVEAFLGHIEDCPDPYGSERSLIWRISATCGLRRAEVVGLSWSDVDISGRTISINQTIVVDNRSLHVKGPKSENGYRTIELDPVTFRQLCRYRAEMVKARVAAGEQYQRTPLGLDLVFRGDRQGGPLRPDRLTRAFKREWAHAGLAPGPTLYGLRHTNGSLLLLKGVPPIHVAAHLGHDLQTLNKVYAHELDPANRQATVAASIGAIYS